ncbi:MAG: hypothetical protein ACHP79_10670, partial [Terriglobales bacterium]
MMNLRLHQRLFTIALRVALLHLLAIIFSVARLAAPVFGADAKEPAPLEHLQPADPGSQHATVVRTGVLGTKDGLT